MRGVFFVGLDANRTRDDLPRPARTSVPAASSSTPATTRRGVRIDQVPEEPPRRPSPTTSCARSTTPGPRPPARDGDGQVSERPQPRAAGARPGVAARRRPASPRSSSSAREVLDERLADLRRRCSSACACATHIVIRFTLPDADPYLFPLVARAGLLRPGGHLPARRGQGAQPGVLVRRRPGALQRDDHRAAQGLPRPRAVPLHDRRRVAAAAAAAARARHRRADQRRLPRRRPRPDRLPAGRVRQDRHRRLPRRLPARAPRRADHRVPALPRASRSRRSSTSGRCW